MNNLNNMWPICHDCPYWGICESPYICGATIQKNKQEGEQPMFVVIDRESKDMFTPIKGGFKTASQANNWCKKNLPIDEVKLWGAKETKTLFRYFIMKR